MIISVKYALVVLKRLWLVKAIFPQLVLKVYFFLVKKNTQYSRNERLMQKKENKEAKQYMKKYCKK